MRFIIWSIFLALLTSCTTQVVPPTDQFSSAQSWAADGVLGYNENGQGFSTGYHWQNTAQNYRIQLIGPLGTWRAMLFGNSHAATLITSEGRTLHAKDAEALMQQNLGWSIPVSDLRYWFLGKPNPATKYQIQHTANGEVQQIQQAGWTIYYAENQTRIVLTQGQKKITVLVEHFENNAKEAA